MSDFKSSKGLALFNILAINVFFSCSPKLVAGVYCPFYPNYPKSKAIVSKAS